MSVLTRTARASGVIAALVAGMLISCSIDGDDRRTTELVEPEQAVSEELMIALGQAKNYHHKADVYLSDGKPELAERALRRLLEVPFPENSPEAEDVRHDARARLAKLLLGRGALDEALDVVREGIDGATRESFFLANLYTVQGEVYEARAQAHDEARARAHDDAEPGDDDAAKRDRRRALEAYAESIAINERLQERLMREGSP